MNFVLVVLLLATMGVTDARFSRPPDLARTGLTARPTCWLANSGITPGYGPERAFDLDPDSYWASNDPKWDLPKDLGLEFSEPVAVGGADIAFVFQDVAWAPEPGGAALQIWRNEEWQTVDASPLIEDRSVVRPGSPQAEEQRVLWHYAFPYVTTTRVRLVVTKGRRPAVADLRVHVAAPAYPTIVAWSADGQETHIPYTCGLNDGDVATAAPLGVLSAVGVQWSKAEAGAELQVVCQRAGFARPVVLSTREWVVEGLANGKWLPLSTRQCADASEWNERSVALGIGWVTYAWRFPAKELSGVRVRAASGSLPAVAELRVFPAPTGARSVRPLPIVRGCSEAIPGDLTFPNWCQELVTQLGKDAVAVDYLASHSPKEGKFWPMFGKAPIGLPHSTRKAGVVWNGTVVAQANLDGRPFALTLAPIAGTLPNVAGLRSEVRRALQGAAVDTKWQDGGLAFSSSAVVAPAKGANGRLFLRFTARNGSRMRREVAFGWAVVFRPQPDTWREPSWSSVAEVPGEYSDRRLRLGGQLVLATDRELEYAPGPEHRLQSHSSLSPGEEKSLEMVVPLDEHDPLTEAPSFAQAAAQAEEFWAEETRGLCQVALPDAHLLRLRDALIRQSLMSSEGDILPYGIYPSVYSGEVFGVEEGWPILALAYWGLGEEAQRFLSATYLTREHLDKSSRHHQYRNGLTAQYVWELYQLTRDRQWLESAMPLLVECAHWTIQQTTQTAEAEPGTLHAGLLPKYRYGGDLAYPAYSLYSNATCW